MLIPYLLLTAAVSSTNICSGNSATLTAISGSVTINTYSWSANAGSSTNTTVVVSPSTTTTYSVVGTNTLTGCVNQSTVEVFVATTPSVNIVVSSNSVCAGNTATLTFGGATDYTITNIPLVVTASVVVTPSATTTYTVIGFDGICYSSETAITINLNSLPTT
jgi:hypothetical protein